MIYGTVIKFCHVLRQISQNQKKAAWTLLAVGTTMVIVGIGGIAATWGSSSGLDPGYTTGSEIFGYMMLGGIVADLVSIPIFISSWLYKRKAMTLSISHQKFHLPQNPTCLKINPTLSLRITF